MKGGWAGAAVLIGLVACSKGRKGPSAADQAKLLRGTWRTACLASGGDTFRQSEYTFQESTGRVGVTLDSYATSSCLPPVLFSYRFSGTYRVPSDATKPMVLGDIREAYLTINEPEYLKVAQRAPGLYGVPGWSRGNPTSLSEKFSASYLADVSRALLPPDFGFLIEGDHLFIGSTVASRENPMFRVATTAFR